MSLQNRACSRTFLVAAAICVVSALCAQDVPASSPTTAPSSAPATTAMAFAATTLSGESLACPNDFAGKLVLVSFWATWCPVCAREMPYWKAAEERFRDSGVVFVGILTDEDRHSPREKIESHVRKQALAWPQIFENGSALSHEFSVESLPYSFLVDGDTGKVIKQGDPLRKKRLMPQLEGAFAEKFPRAALPPPATQPAASQPASKPASSRPVTNPSKAQPGQKPSPVTQPVKKP